MTFCPHLPSRREALIGAGTLFAWTQMPRLARAEGRDPRLLVIVLRGALDGLGAVAPVGDAYDPAPPATVDMANFVPHRPARPEKSEGGKKFILGVSNTLVGNGFREEMICGAKAQALASGDRVPDQRAS